MGSKKQEQTGMRGKREFNYRKYHWPEPDVTVFSGEKILMRGLISDIVKLVDTW